MVLRESGGSLSWIRDNGSEPRTVYDAQFAPTRLLTLRTRRSAAYKGIHALLLRTRCSKSLGAVASDLGVSISRTPHEGGGCANHGAKCAVRPRSWELEASGALLGCRWTRRNPVGHAGASTADRTRG